MRYVHIDPDCCSCGDGEHVEPVEDDEGFIVCACCHHDIREDWEADA